MCRSGLAAMAESWKWDSVGHREVREVLARPSAAVGRWGWERGRRWKIFEGRMTERGMWGWEPASRSSLWQMPGNHAVLERGCTETAGRSPR